MEATICKNCRHINQPEMAFCTNCGQPISIIKELQIKTLPKLDAAAAAGELGGGKRRWSLWIGGLLGCLGLSALAVAAIIAAGSFAGRIKNTKSPDPSPNPESTAPAPDQSNPALAPADDRKSAETHLLEILGDRREAGQFRQVSATVVPAKEYFPRALGAVQASYHNGSRYVSVSIGKYSDFEPAKKDFEEQFSTISQKGGKTQVLTPPADGTIHGVYQYKNNSYAEYCTKSAFCYRMASADAGALKTFIENFVKP